MWVWACSLRTGSRCQISDMNQTCLLKHPHLWLTSVSVAAEFWTRRERPPLSLTLLFFSTMSLLSSPERPDLLPWDSCSRWPLSKVYILFTLTHQVTSLLQSFGGPASNRAADFSTISSHTSDGDSQCYRRHIHLKKEVTWYWGQQFSPRLRSFQMAEGSSSADIKLSYPFVLSNDVWQYKSAAWICIIKILMTRLSSPHIPTPYLLMKMNYLCRHQTPQTHTRTHTRTHLFV